MNTTRDFDRRAAAWLADGPSELNDRVLDAALREVHLTHQRRRWSAPWRTTLMSLRLGLAAAVALVVIGLGGALYIGGGGPAPTTASTPTAVPTAGPTPSRAPGPFTSPLYGYTVDVPAGWTITPTVVAWPAGVDPNPDLFAGPPASPDFDNVYVAAQPVPDGMTSAAWQLDYAQLVAASGRDCKGPVDAWTDAVVGALEIRRLDLECQGLHYTDVAFVVDGTGYVMSGNRVVIAHFLDTFQPGA
jgi:hypothetical protein